MAAVTLRFKAVSLDIDTSAKVITGLHVDYDFTNPAGAVVSGTFNGVPSVSQSDDIWGILRHYLGGMVGALGAPPPIPPMPSPPSPPSS